MKKKKKVPTLPNHITPVMPDPAKGIDIFNNSCNTNDIGVGLSEDIYNNIYSDLIGLYESTQSKLDAKDKKKLADFIEKTDDINEVETYIKGLLSSKNESLLEYVEPTDEIEDEFDKELHDCDRNIYDELPRWCQLYLDEFDGPWISYGRLPSGTYFYSDNYDTYFFDDLDDFIEDQKYNIRQAAEMYKDSSEDYDYSDEFVELLSSNLEKVLNENLLVESNGNLPDDIHDYDWNPSSPYYDGLEAQDADEFDSEVEIEFSQRGILSNGYWNIDDFENDLTTAKFDVKVDYDGSVYFNLDDWEVQDALYEALNSDKVQQRLPLDLSGVYKVSGVISIPYSVENITYYHTLDKDWGDEYEYDFSDIHTNFYPENAAVEMINIERI